MESKQANTDAEEGKYILSPIPNFFDQYHLPAGEHVCDLDEVEQRFVTSDRREKVWADFMRLYDRLSSLGLYPKSLLIDGSFVTGRENPGDVDFGALFPADVVRHALQNAEDPHDLAAIKMLVDSSHRNQSLIRILFGAHMLVAANECGLRLISKLFRTGGEQFGKLKERDPKKDPDWVKIPKEKGILRVNF